jgi:phosphoesterase RecJ-like protein
MERNGAAAARDQVLAELRRLDRFCLITHEHPDGDALGSLVGMHRILTALGKDSVMLMGPDEFPLPYEYRFFDLEGLSTVAPADVLERTVVYLDCGNLDRSPLDVVKGADAHILNIDHHHDNTHFGTINYVDPLSSCTAEMVWDLMNALEVTPDAELAEALYVGVVTDTGKFMYENTGPRAHRMAAALIEAGVDTHVVYRRLYEDVPFSKLELLGRALGRVQRYEDGALTMTVLTRDDFDETGSSDSYSEGIIDHLRAVDGAKVAALARAVVDAEQPGRKKVSLRSTDGEIDVSAIARAGGGGGHRQAAGFTTSLDQPALVAFLLEQMALQRAASARDEPSPVA